MMDEELETLINADAWFESLILQEPAPDWDELDEGKNGLTWEGG